MTKTEIEKAAEEYVTKEICYGGLEYSTFGKTSEECTKSFIAGANHVQVKLEAADIINRLINAEDALRIIYHISSDGKIAKDAKECAAKITASLAKWREGV